MPTKLSDEQLDREVLHLLKQHRGRTNPIGRWEMVHRIFGPGSITDQSDQNIYDRQIRESVQRLRKAGALICDMGDGAGRSLPETVEEYRAFAAKFGSRAYDVLDTLREMDKAAEQEFPDLKQPKLL
jgi:hypothetical protein